MTQEQQEPYTLTHNIFPANGDTCSREICVLVFFNILNVESVSGAIGSPFGFFIRPFIGIQEE